MQSADCRPNNYGLWACLAVFVPVANLKNFGILNAGPGVYVSCRRSGAGPGTSSALVVPLRECSERLCEILSLQHLLLVFSNVSAHQFNRNCRLTNSEYNRYWHYPPRRQSP